MESVIIAAPHGFKLDAFMRTLSAKWPVQSVTSTRILIQSLGGRVWLEAADDLQKEYDPEALRKVLALIADPEFFILDFNDLSLAKEVLAAIGNDPQLVIDNDHGLVLQGDEFVSLLKRDPGWDWRGESPHQDRGAD